jgi:hypothetical protein
MEQREREQPTLERIDRFFFSDGGQPSTLITGSTPYLRSAQITPRCYYTVLMDAWRRKGSTFVHSGVVFQVSKRWSLRHVIALYKMSARLPSWIGRCAIRLIS